MNREYHKWWSKHLEREMELLVFGHAGAKVLIFPTRSGRFYEYENLRIINRLRDKLDTGHIQLFCVDSIYSETFYCWWAHPSGRINRQKAYENYILHEVFPFMQQKNTHSCVISHGCSLGAYQAASLAFRHPHLFKKLVAFSGRYDLTLNVEHFNDLLSGFYNEDVYFHTPTHFLPNLECSSQLNALKDMEIILTIGREDPFLQNNHQLSEILYSKGIDHQLIVWEERAHSGFYWRRMAPIYI